MKKKYYSSGLIGLLLIGGLIFIFLTELEESTIKPKKNIKSTIEISVDIIKEEKKREMKEKKPISTPTSSAKEKTKEKVITNSGENNENNFNGELPPISANYRKHLGFKKYAKEMTKRDALFFIHDTDRNKLYKINFLDRSIAEKDIKSIELNKYSSRSRIITDEPALDYIVNSAKKKYDIKSPEVILLVPKYLEKRILNSLNKSSIPLNKVSQFKAYYINNTGKLTLSIHSAVISGKTINTNIEIKL